MRNPRDPSPYWQYRQLGMKVINGTVTLIHFGNHPIVLTVTIGGKPMIKEPTH